MSEANLVYLIFAIAMAHIIAGFAWILYKVMGKKKK